MNTVMRTYWVLLYLLIFQSLPAQEGRFDLSLVEDMVREGDEYDRLLQRMRDGDKTLTTTDYRYLYYGFQFRDEYTGNLDTIHYYIGELVEQKRFVRAYEASKKALELNPVSLRLLLYSIQSGREIGISPDELSLYTQPFLEITYVISLSGTGKSERAAFKALSITDEYVMMQFYFGITEVIDSEIIEHGGRIYDCFHINPTPEYNSNRIYFDITPSILKMTELAPPEDH